MFLLMPSLRSSAAILLRSCLSQCARGETLLALRCFSVGWVLSMTLKGFHGDSFCVLCSSLLMRVGARIRRSFGARCTVPVFWLTAQRRRGWYGASWEGACLQGRGSSRLSSMVAVWTSTRLRPPSRGGARGLSHLANRRGSSLASAAHHGCEATAGGGGAICRPAAGALGNYQGERVFALGSPRATARTSPRNCQGSRISSNGSRRGGCLRWRPSC